MKKLLIGLFVFIMACSCVFAEEETTEYQESVNSCAESVLKYGKAIGSTITKDGYIFTVENMYIDKEVSYIILSVKRTDGNAIKDKEYICLDNITLEDEKKHQLDGFSCQLWEKTGGSDKKLYYLIRGTGDIFDNKTVKWQLEVGRSMQFSEIEVGCESDLVGYLAKQQKVAIGKNPKWEEMNRLKSESPEEYQQLSLMLPEMPENTLTEGKLSMPLIKGNGKHQIKDIGFVDGALHMVVASEEAEDWTDVEIVTMKLKDLNGNDLYADKWWQVNDATYAGDSADEYYVFNIPDLDALRKYKVAIDFVGLEELTKGPWRIGVKIADDSRCVAKQTDEFISYGDEKKAKVKAIAIRPSSVKVTLAFSEEQDYYEETAVSLQMKDGTSIEGRLDSSSEVGKQLTILYLFPQGGLIDISQVKSVTVNGKVMGVIK